MIKKQKDKLILSFSFYQYTLFIKFMIGFETMSGNSFGKIFKITTFGESHGEALGVIIDGCPSGIEIDIERLQKALDRRKPGQSSPDGKLSSSVTSR